ncbi:transposase [Kocuria rhizosphaericola]|uniref:transposase n=1 Tax=Kocuria rhizosphaericola TaxID=3376284 RepID=UPI0037ABFCE6
MQETPGIGPVTAAIIVCAYSHHGRIRSGAAFAALAGVAPRPASSGNTTRHRLNRSGDRQLNRAFETIVRTRISFDPVTRDTLPAPGPPVRVHVRSGATSSATSPAPFSGSCRPSWVDSIHRRIILGAAPGRRMLRPVAGSRSPARAADCAA